jgi:hypothetical protein
VIGEGNSVLHRRDRIGHVFIQVSERLIVGCKSNPRWQRYRRSLVSLRQIKK